MDRDNILNALKLAVAFVAAAWAGLHPLYQALVVLIVADVVTGVLASVVSGEKLSSDISFRGMAKKAMEVLMVAIAAYLEPHAGGLPLGPAIAGYWCAHEGLSILENYGQAGLPIPQALRDVLDKLNPEHSTEVQRAKEA